jgi:hypothetical protein
MTEAEWLRCTTPWEMLNFQRDRASPRQFRLFACACCRRIWHLLDVAAQQAIACAERYGGERGVSKGQLKKAHKLIAPRRYEYDSPAWNAARAAQEATAVNLAAPHGEYRVRQADTTTDQASLAVVPAQDRVGEYNTWAFGSSRLEERAAHAELLRDILGNPFNPPPPQSSSLLAWHDGLVVRLARAAWEESVQPSGQLDPARLAVLADALLDAGCTDNALLDHLREPGPHVRGCWALDRLTDRGLA